MDYFTFKKGGGRLLGRAHL